MQKHTKWCKNLKKYWQEKDINNIINLFDENVEYYETPNQKLSSSEELRMVWEEIKDQDTKNIEVKILCTENNKCIANFLLTGKETYDMIYEIVLNENNKCTYFKQWYMEL